MARPRIKEALKRRAISISLDPEIIKLLKKQTLNMSAYIEQLITKELLKKASK